MKNFTITGALAIFALIGAISSAVFTAETRYAKDDNLQAVGERLDIKILEDRLFFLRQQIWTLEKQFGQRCRKLRDPVCYSIHRHLRAGPRKNFKSSCRNCRNLRTERHSQALDHTLLHNIRG